MGSSHLPTTVVIIDENDQRDSFNALLNDPHFHVIYYTDYDKFLQKQSLKNLSFIIIREKNQKDQIVQYQNSLTALTQDNRRQLTEMFEHVSSKKSIPLKERLISYIRKYSLEKLVLYILVEDKHKFKLPDYQSPYITLVASTVEAIKENILSNPQREEPFDFKFRRMVKDLYKRTAIKIIYDGKGEKKEKEEADAEWDDLLTKNELSYNICWGLDKFRKDLISNFSEYIIVINSKKMLHEIIREKDKRQLQSKIIFLGSEEGLEEKDKLAVWMINDGKTASNRTKIAKTIKNCIDKIVDEETLLSQNTIVFTNLQYTQEEKEYLKTQIIDRLRKKQSEHVQTETDIANLNLQIVSAYDNLKQKLISSVFSFLITFDCLIPDIEQLKRWIRKEKLNYRVYIYSAEQKPKTIETLLKAKQGNPAAMREYLDKRIVDIIKGASFKVKFQISPIDSITTYQANTKVIKHLTSKMGLITTNIPHRSQFTEKYLRRNRQQFIESYHLICRYDNYQQDLAALLDSEGEISLQKDTSPVKIKSALSENSYFGKVKIIIFDERDKIRKNWQKISKDHRIVFVHYNLSHIDDYLDNVFTSKVAVSFFVKKALPTFFEAMYKIEDNIEKGSFADIKMTSSIMAKSKLLKEVFNDDNFKMSMEFKQSFYKFSSQTELNPDFAAFLKAYCNLWRVGYQLVKDPSEMKDSLNALKQDIKRCLFKCKSYDLIDVSNDEFFYFYLDRLDACHTFLDLQIAVIYIFSLPHGFADIFQNIFKNPYTTCLTPKIFSSYLVTLMTTFISFEDEVMGKTRVVTYVDDKDIETMSQIEEKETLYNTCFLQCGKDESKQQNEQNNCLFFQFQDMPMLAESRIKDYLFIERFSFYKESTEYLIAPYTEFTVKEKTLNNGKYHIVLTHRPRSEGNFITQILSNNDVDQQQLFNVIKDEIEYIEQHSSQKQDSSIIKGTKSLYKKAELISLNEQKLQLVKSIKEGFEYRDFLHELESQHYMSALSHIFRKETTKKSTSELQALKFKHMLGVERSYLSFKMNEYHVSVEELEKVILFLDARVKEANEDEVLLKVKVYQQKIEEVIRNRIGKLDELQREEKGSQKSREMHWTVRYLPTREQFYLQPDRRDGKILLPFHIAHPFSQNQTQEKDHPFYSVTTLEDVMQQDKQLRLKLQGKNTFGKGETEYKDQEGKGKSDKKKKKEHNKDSSPL